MIFANKKQQAQKQQTSSTSSSTQQPTQTTEQPKPKTGREIVVRVRGKDGLFRYEVDPSEPIIDISKPLEKDIDVAAQFQSLSLDVKGPALSPNLTLSAANVKHGQMLYLNYDAKNVKSKQDIEDEKKRELLKKELGDMDDLNNLGLKYRSKYWTVDSYSKLVEQYKIRIRHQVRILAL